MKKFIVCLALLLIISCKKEDNQCFEPASITPILVAKGEYIGYNNDKPIFKSIANTSNWKDFGNLVFDKYNSLPPSLYAESIDFNNYLIIAAIDIPRPNGGHTIDITSIIENQNNIKVCVQKFSNGNFTAVISQPCHIVKIPKSSKPIVFEQLF